MADAGAKHGLLDVSKLKSADYRELPKMLLGAPGLRAGGDEPALFEKPPEFSDAAALLEGKPPDYSLYHGLSSILNGLSSGPAQVMGLFRALNTEDIVVRLYQPRRPLSGKPLEALHFILNRGHAKLAIKKRWVGPKAPTWLALLAAVYNGHLGDREAFYERKDLGGPENAAWLVLFGRDSSRAKYEAGDDDAGRKKAGTSTAGGSGASGTGAAELTARILGVGDMDFDKELFTTRIFAETPAVASRLMKEWTTWVRKAPLVTSTGLRAGLTREKVGKLAVFRKWLDGRAGLSAELKLRLLLFMEANGALVADEKERYGKGPLSIANGIREAVRLGNQVAVGLSESDPAITELCEKDQRTTAVAGVHSLSVPNAPAGRAIQYIALRAAKGGGRRYKWREKDDVHSLVSEPSKKGEYWMELQELLRRAERIFVGADAVAALARLPEVSSFTLELTGDPNAKTSWPE